MTEVGFENAVNPSLGAPGRASMRATVSKPTSVIGARPHDFWFVVSLTGDARIEWFAQSDP